MATITVPGMFLTGNHAGRPGSGVGKGTLYSCTTHGLIYQTTDTGSTWGTWATLGASPSGSITASGYTQNTARILGRTTASSGAIEEITVGSGLTLAAGALTASGSSAPIASGTSNPGSPSNNDLFYRTDLDLLIFYDGTRWCTLDLFRESFGIGATLAPATGTTVLGRLTPWSTTYDLWLDAFFTSTYVLTTSDGSNFWTITAEKFDSADARTSLASFSTGTTPDAANTWIQRRTAIGAAYVASSFRGFDVIAAKTASAGNLFFACSLSYRLIVT